MIKRALAVVLACSLFSCGQFFLSVPEKIAESVVFVKNSSGVVVYSDKEKTLVLTAYHVVGDGILKAACSGCGNYDVEISYVYDDFTKKIPDIIYEDFYATNIEFDEKFDLAVIEIHPGKKLLYSEISEKMPILGEQIWIGSNPNNNYRSIRIGAVSSVNRVVGKRPVVELSGGIVYGSSGGGAFAKDGKLFGVIQMVDHLETDFCSITAINGKIEGFKCVDVPLTDIGYVSHPLILKRFLLNGVYGDDFSYLQ